MTITNKKLGNDFECEFCEILFEKGFWIHNIAQTQVGQPADIIAVRKGKAFLIDCKVCTSNRFTLSRVEDNQHLSMDLWRDCDNGEPWFSIKLGNDIYMVTHWNIKALLNSGQSSMNEQDLHEYGVPLDKWLKKQCK